MASGELKAPEAQADWLGQPSQAEFFPAVSASGPTHSELALAGVAAAALSSVFVIVGFVVLCFYGIVFLCLAAFYL